MNKIFTHLAHPISSSEYRSSHHTQGTIAFYIFGTLHMLLTLTWKLQLLFFLTNFYSCFKTQLPWTLSWKPSCFPLSGVVDSMGPYSSLQAPFQHFDINLWFWVHASAFSSWIWTLDLCIPFLCLWHPGWLSHTEWINTQKRKRFNPKTNTFGIFLLS